MPWWAEPHRHTVIGQFVCVCICVCVCMFAWIFARQQKIKISAGNCIIEIVSLRGFVHLLSCDLLTQPRRSKQVGKCKDDIAKPGPIGIDNNTHPDQSKLSYSLFLLCR